MPATILAAFTSFFVIAEIVTLAVFAVAAAKIEKRPHTGWILTLPAYFIFGTLAAYKGLAELLFNPFYWDKTEHGMFGGVTDGSVSGDGTGVNAQSCLESDGQVVAQRL